MVSQTPLRLPGWSAVPRSYNEGTALSRALLSTTGTVRFPFNAVILSAAKDLHLFFRDSWSHAVPSLVAGASSSVNATRRSNSNRAKDVNPFRWLATCLALILPLSALHSQQSSGTTIQGRVSNRDGAPVANAIVKLEHAGAAAADTHTQPDGTFAFSGLLPGDYTITLASGGAHASVTIHAGQVNAPPVSLIAPDTSSRAEAMQFADDPKFTIAAVTDWTAAGGHGSDAVLRTSEALNRKTLALKPVQPSSAEPTEEWKKKENMLRAAQQADPGSFAPNHALGHFYLRAEKFDLAVPPLQAACKIDPGDSRNEYELALALNGSGRHAEAREHVPKLAASGESGDVHRLAGEIDEKLGDPLSAVHEFERAVRADPSEQNYFEWGSELLLHRAVWQARDVFAAGVKAYPKSQRMLTALGAALFAGALYDEAAQRLCEASDLNPADPEPYTFMGKVEISAPNPLPCVEQRLARYVGQNPQDSLANYFYAMALWKQKGQAADSPTLARVEDLLNMAVRIDPKCSDAYLQLGVLQATRREYQKAIAFYSKAIEANPQFSEAHYRLGIAYDRVGEKEKAAEQLRLHGEIEKQQAAAIEKQRREVKQFQVVVDGKSADAHPDDRR